MKLKRLLYKIDYKVLQGSDTVDISNLSYEFNKKLDDFVYVAIVGNNIDGHDYVNEAINNGAKVLVVSKKVLVESNVVVILVDDANKILSRLSMNYFDNPQEKIKTIAITGTKGKTTTSFMIKNIIERAGYNCGLIGTIGIYIKDKYYESKNTTPISYDILKYINEMVKEGLEYVVIEVSSQALKYDRVSGILFDYGLFTNLTKDHISMYEHNDMDDYVSSKSMLFRQCKIGIFNIDDSYYNKIVFNATCKVMTYGYSKDAMLRVCKLDLYNDENKLGIDMVLEGMVNDSFRISVPGKFSSYNAMGAILVCNLLGIDISYMKEVLSNFSVLGRCEGIKIFDKGMLFIDYAHNGDSTKSILSSIREYNPRRIVTIFGCGGNRSKIRRYEMGEAAFRYSDMCIITEDNNRYEDFSSIASDILNGAININCDYKIIPDRKDAIKYAIDNICDGDIIMLIGKGHETYKEINGVRYPFDERIIVNDILNNSC